MNNLDRQLARDNRRGAEIPVSPRSGTTPAAGQEPNALTDQSKPTFPILVASMDGKDYLDVGCNNCGHIWRCESVDASITAVECSGCERCGSAMVFYRYEQGAICDGCGKLDFTHPKDLDHCCSRACMLQKAYKAELPLRHAIANPERTRDDVGREYGKLLSVAKAINWPELNRLIIERWSEAGLAYIKARAWTKEEIAA